MNTKEIHFITMYHEIHRLRYVEHFSIQRIANHLSINFRTVKNYLDMSPEDFEHYLDSIKRRSSLLDTYREFISGYLNKNEDAPASVVHDRLKEHYPTFPVVDPKTVYNFVWRLRNVSPRKNTHFSENGFFRSLPANVFFMKPVSKEEFLAILESQQKCGISIKDFCANESYTVSSFHYWKTKFGLTRPFNNHAPDAPTNMLAPINVNLPIKAPVSSPVLSPRTVRERSGSNYWEVSKSASLVVPRQRSRSIY